MVTNLHLFNPVQIQTEGENPPFLIHALISIYPSCYNHSIIYTSQWVIGANVKYKTRIFYSTINVLNRLWYYVIAQTSHVLEPSPCDVRSDEYFSLVNTYISHITGYECWAVRKANSRSEQNSSIHNAIFLIGPQTIAASYEHHMLSGNKTKFQNNDQ